MIAQSESDMRRQLLAINNDPSLNSIQKSQLSQRLHMPVTNSSQQAFPPFCQPVGTSSQPNSNQAHSQPPLPPNEALSCQHYKSKKCSRFYFDCCNTVDPCHRCHMARGCDRKPPQISSIQCNDCGTKQEPSQRCVNPACGVQFSNSYCDKCKIWTELDIVHCDHCGICRVGKPSSVFHCHTCDACFAKESQGTHRCAKSKLKDSSCPICLESVHTAQKASNILPCGHVVHGDCWKEAARKGEYRCPTCRKSLVDMRPVWTSIRRSISLQPIPRGFFPIQSGDLTNSPFGDFLVMGKRQANSGVNSDKVSTMCEGYLTGWELANGQRVRATIAEHCLDKKRDITVWCYDCEKKCDTEFHFLGLECRHCGGFNTSKG